jgi:hypothetical protein
MRILFCLAASLLSVHGTAFGWGCDGHQIVALIARAHLTSSTSAAVDKILRESPIEPGHYRFCQDTPTDLMAVAAPWADEVKQAEKTSLWHFIDIPVAVKAGDSATWCEPIGPPAGNKERSGCLVSAIAYDWAIVRDRRKPAADRARALRYLIHFLGDLSQPLHVSDNHDQGGNCTSIGAPFLDKLTTLHGLWDFDLITHELRTKRTSETLLAASIDREFAAHWKGWGESGVDIQRFAWEGHQIARTVAYADLRPPIPIESPAQGTANRAACDAGRAYVARMHIVIDERYINHTSAVIHQQLAKAGYWLAALLNQTL